MPQGHRRGPALATLAIAGAALVWAVVSLRSGAPAVGTDTSMRVSEVLGAPPDGFASADRVRPFRFPRDHGPHPGYRNEWWYFTGNVATAEGRPFGYQLTFFRTALEPPNADEAAQRRSAWATSQVYMAHFALSDVEAEQLHAFERFSRGAAGLAGARSRPTSPSFRVWVEDWEARSAGEPLFPMRLVARQDGVEIDLTLTQDKPGVLQGDQGLSAKSAEAGHASYYYSHTRIGTRGRIALGSRAFEVAGASWLDREWGSSALGRTQVGWDWFAIQLDDGHDLMIAQVRERDGAPPYEIGALVSPEGRIEALDGDAIELHVLDHWRSDATGARYPGRWRVAVPARDLSLEVTPAFADQELRLSIRYWEGATRVVGALDGRPVQGVGYMELTGYAETPSP